MDAPDFKPVYILGAGASAGLGAPLLTNFMLKARELRYAPNFLEKYREHFDRVFRYQGELLKSRRYLGIDVDNLEVLYSILDMDCQLADWDNTTSLPDEVSALFETRRSLQVLIVEVLRLAIARQQWYSELLRSFAASPTSAFITLNYDLAIENALKESVAQNAVPLKVSYGEERQSTFLDESAAFRLVLKLHGSVNWTWCSSCRKFVAHPETKSPLEMENSVLSYHDVGCNSAASEIVIVPPTWNKTSVNPKIVNVWCNAIELLKRATHLLIVGYSMPRTDAFFDQILTLGLRQNSNLKRIIIINPSEEMERISQSLFDGHYRHRSVVHLCCKMSQLNNARHMPINNQQDIQAIIDSVK